MELWKTAGSLHTISQYYDLLYIRYEYSNKNMLCKKTLIKYSQKYGVIKAAIRCKTNSLYIKQYRISYRYGRQTLTGYSHSIIISIIHKTSPGFSFGVVCFCFDNFTWQTGKLEYNSALLKAITQKGAPLREEN